LENPEALFPYRAPHLAEKKLLYDVGLPIPDIVLKCCMMDPAVRNKYGVPYPFPKTLPWLRKGCYLWIDQSMGGHVIPLYAGQASHLYDRLLQHWNATSNTFPWAINYLVSLMDCEGQECGTGVLDVLIWWMKTKKERIRLEHLLLGVLTPLCNRG